MMRRFFVLVVMLVLLCAPVVMVEGYSGYINAFSLDPYFEGIGSGTNSGVGTKTNSSVPWWTDFDKIGTPEYYIMYDSVDQYLRGSTTFTINDTTGVFATGSVQMLNGSFGYSGAVLRKQYYYLQFDTWTPGSRSGILSGLMKFSAGGVAAIPESPLVNGAFVGTTWSANIGNATMGGGSSGGKCVMSAGAIAYGFPAISLVSYDVTYTSGYGDATLANLVYTKALDNDLASNMQIRSASGALLQSSGFTAKTDGANWNLIGNNYYLSMYVSGLSPYYFNSSLFTFTAVPPTPTPTPTPTPVPTSTIYSGAPVGYVRTTVYAQDGDTGSLITGATLNLRDVQNGTWVNGTSSSAGKIIDVLSGHTLDIYGLYPGVYQTTQELGASPGGSYYLPLYRTPLAAPGGYVNLLVAVYDETTLQSLSGVSVTVRLPSGSSSTGTTGGGGTVSFTPSNKTVLIVTATKTGYTSVTKSITTGTFADQVLTINLPKITVSSTVTATPLPGEVTARPTVDTRTNTQKDAALMDTVREWGALLIPFACLMTFLYLAGYKA